MQMYGWSLTIAAVPDSATPHLADWPSLNCPPANRSRRHTSYLRNEAGLWVAY